MKKILVIGLIGCLLTSGLLNGCGVTGGQARELTKGTGSTDVIVCTDGVKEGDTSVWDFSYALFSKNLTETNPVMSPVSAYFAMGMVGVGAAGETLDEFHAVMGDDMMDVSGKLMESLPAEEKNLTVNIANSVWVDDNMQADEVWLSEVSDFYKGEVYQMPLVKAMQDINNWVEDKTKGLIDSILDEPLSEAARLAVINAIYFKGDWETPFAPESTTTDTFTREDGTAADVEMMRSYSENYSYINGDGFDGVVLPYLDGSYAFVAMKPTDGQTVRQMYESMNLENMKQLVDGAESRLINLKLPKFKVEFDKYLNEDLISMGIEKAFDFGSADLSGLGTSDDGQNLYISVVRQKAVLIVDEEGTEAAAVTAAVVECGSAMPVEEPMDVFFDKPFFYMVYDTESGVPLFMGIYDEPM